MVLGDNLLFVAIVGESNKIWSEILVCAYHVLVFDAVFCSQQISPAVALTSLLLLSASSLGEYISCKYIL